MLTDQQIEDIHHKYAPNELVFDLVYGHCQIVNEIAQWSAQNISVTDEVDTELLRNVALLHDIGTYILFDEYGKAENDRLYPLHAILGAKIILDEGFDSRIADIVETHVLLGLSRQEIIEKPWQLPARDYIPKSIEGELLCYADRFHSKKPTFNDFDNFLNRLKVGLPIQAARFEEWSKKFGIPDINSLVFRYDHVK